MEKIKANVTKTNMTGNLPVKKFKAGAISATVWENQNKTDKGDEITYLSITLERNYKDKSGEWKTTNSYRATDLPKASLVLNKAFEFISLNQEAEI